MDHTDLDNQIADLGDLADEASCGQRRWKEVWSEIKAINASFRKVRHTTTEEREDAWNRFQEIVLFVKKSQQQQQGNLKPELISHLNCVTTSCDKRRVGALSLSLKV